MDRDFYFDNDFITVITQAMDEAERRKIPFVPNILIVKIIYDSCEESFFKKLINFLGLNPKDIEKACEKQIDLCIKNEDYNNWGLDIIVFDEAEAVSLSGEGTIDELDFFISLVLLKEKYFVNFFAEFNKDLADVELYFRGARNKVVESIYNRSRYYS